MVYPTMNASAKTDHIINVRITHKTAHVPLMEAVAFKDKESALKELNLFSSLEEALILQTCNRIELYLVCEDGFDALVLAKTYLANRAGSCSQEAIGAIETSSDQEALGHLLRVASGLESMVIGEDQVLNQVWDAYLEAEKAKTAGPILNLMFNRAIKVGNRVRKETGINKGAVSIGSAAVELAATITGSLEDKKILVMGAGEIGTLVAKALARRCLSPIFIANRTHDRAVRLAEELSGQAVKFDQLENVLVDADVVICSTGAPHYLLTKEIISKLKTKRTNKNDLVIVDISNPRNVEKAVTEISGIKLYNIDDLQVITDKNKLERQKCTETAESIIQEELDELTCDVKSQSVRLIISDLLSHTEEVRQKALAKALSILGEVNEKERKVLEDLTSILLKQTFVPIVENLRAAAVNGDQQLIETAVKLFGKNGEKSVDDKTR
ncbi:MAG: glutamyl-tRNA reductase [Candidatus Bathyarchaeota archaeon]|nr:glutamyl-tRNA reductase [Candidatus Bathyarchaeota archaeon]